MNERLEISLNLESVDMALVHLLEQSQGATEDHLIRPDHRLRPSLGLVRIRELMVRASDYRHKPDGFAVIHTRQGKDGRIDGKILNRTTRGVPAIVGEDDADATKAVLACLDDLGVGGFAYSNVKKIQTRAKI
jgi:hypothetical protein